VSTLGTTPQTGSAADGVTCHFDSGMSNARFNRNDDGDSGALSAAEVARTRGGSSSTMTTSSNADIRDLLRLIARIHMLAAISRATLLPLNDSRNRPGGSFSAHSVMSSAVRRPSASMQRSSLWAQQTVGKE
jgi:hypothetical protein